MGAFYGSDSACLDDLPLISVDISDPATLIGQRLARRLQTAHGALAFINDDPDGGLDVRQYVNAKVTPNFRASVEQEIRSECLKDEEVQDAQVRTNFAVGLLAVTIAVTAGSGPFTLVLNVGEVDVEAIIVQAAA